MDTADASAQPAGGDDPFAKLRSTAFPSAIPPEELRSLEAKAVEQLLRLPPEAVASLTHTISANVDPMAAEPYATTALLYARIRVTGVSCGFEKCASLLQEYARFVDAAPQRLVRDLPLRWIALGREASRIVMGSPPATMAPTATPNTAFASLPHGSNATSAETPRETLVLDDNRNAAMEDDVAAVDATRVANSERTNAQREPNDSTRNGRTSCAAASDVNLNESRARLQSAVNGRDSNEPLCVQMAGALVHTMRQACDKLSPTPRHVVPLHADFLAVCAKAKLYRLCLAFASENRQSFHISATGISAADVMCIHYYLALAHIALKRFASALQHCRLALAVPAQSVSDVAVAVYRKYLLVLLLLHGEATANLTISSYKNSRLKPYAPEYHDLAAAFADTKPAAVANISAANRDKFEEDGNYGLVCQVVSALPKRTIQKLKRSYITLTLGQIAKKADLGSPEAAEAVLLQMIEEGMIRAEINAQTQVVSFGDDADDNADDTDAVISTWRGSNARMGARAPENVFDKPGALDARVDDALSYAERIRAFRDSVLCDRVYVSRKLKDDQERLLVSDVAGMDEDDPDIE